MRITHRHGRVQVHLAEVEAGVLAGLFDDLGVALDALPADDPVRARLFPDGYRDDAEAAAEFRELTESALRAGKVERLGQCRAELPPGGGRLDLDGDATQRWLTVLNDLRLALGTRLGITEDDQPPTDVADSADPQVQTRAVYYWLTWLQDALVRAAMS